ncbi:MAG: hypothetical protein HeimC3_10390 [Candidatus Heimdallarchaeota archaeon LC_3]|nr:MAG: hypothetical protein HeimC3_10390 [Candidatus Heimdallarchaeota archaeon LC_3]
MKIRPKFTSDWKIKMEIVNNFLQQPWVIPALSKTIEESKSIKSISLFFNEKLKWNTALKSEKKDKLETISDLTFKGIHKLWKNTFGNTLGYLKEFEIEGGQNRLFFHSIDSLTWLGTISNILETNSSIIQNFIINSLDFQILEEKLVENQFIGITTSEGFKIWLKSRIPDFIFEDAIISSLTAIERIQLELDLGTISECNIESNNNKNLLIKINKSNELALTKFDDSIEYDSRLDSLFSSLIRFPQKITIPGQILDYIATQSIKTINPLMEEMKATPIESEISEDEIISLIGFDEELLDRMEKTIKAIASNYNIQEISIPYLGQKIFRLPSAVIQLSLSYLIGQGRIKDAKLKFSNPSILYPDILKLDLFSPNENELEIMSKIKEFYQEINKPLKDLIILLDRFQYLSSTTQVFNELEAIRQNTDSYPLITLSRDINSIITSLNEKIIITEKKDLIDKSKIINRIRVGMESLKIKMSIFNKDIDLLNRVLHRFLPYPITINEFNDNSGLELIFECNSNQCSKNRTILVHKSIEAWRKFLLFLDDKKLSTSIKEFIKPLKENIDLLNNEIDEDLIKKLLWDLDTIILTNEERELLISDINNEKSLESSETVISLIKSQCEICEKWFCVDHYNNDQFKCNTHQKLMNL